MYLPSYRTGYARSAGDSQAPDQRRGLVGAWVPALGHTGTDVRDIIKGRHGTFTGFAASNGWSVKNQWAIEYDGANDYINVGDFNDYSFTNGSTQDEPFSIFAVAYCRSWGAGKGTIIGKATDGSSVEWRLTGNDTGQMGLFLNDSTTSHYVAARTTANQPTNQWINYHATCDGSGSENGITVYINGEAVPNDNLTLGTYVAMHQTSAPVTLGLQFTNAPSSDRYWDGWLAQIRLYNRELSASEVLEMHRDPMATWRIRELQSYLAQAASPPSPPAALPDYDLSYNCGKDLAVDLTSFPCLR